MLMKSFSFCWDFQFMIFLSLQISHFTSFKTKILGFNIQCGFRTNRWKPNEPSVYSQSSGQNVTSYNWEKKGEKVNIYSGKSSKIHMTKKMWPQFSCSLFSSLLRTFYILTIHIHSYYIFILTFIHIWKCTLFPHKISKA